MGHPGALWWRDGKDNVSSTLKAAQPPGHWRGSCHFPDNAAAMTSWGAHSAFAEHWLLWANAQGMADTTGQPEPSAPHTCASREENGGENTGKGKFLYMSTAGFTAEEMRRVWRSQQVGFSFLEVSTYLATQTLTAASLLSQGQTQHCVTLKLGTLTLLKVWMDETTQSTNKNTAMEAWCMKQHN